MRYVINSGSKDVSKGVNALLEKLKPQVQGNLKKKDHYYSKQIKK
jgi:hypothetical protein